MLEEDNYRSLINKMAAKRAVERFILSFIAICVVIIGVLLFFENRSLTTEIKGQQLAAQQQTKLAQDSNRALQQQTKEIKGYILCIANFFAQPDRANLTLSDLRDCQFNSAGFSQPAGLPTSVTTGQAHSTVPISPQTNSSHAPQITTSAPPPEPNPGHPQQPAPGSIFQPVSNLLQSAVSNAAGLLKNLGLG